MRKHTLLALSFLLATAPLATAQQPPDPYQRMLASQKQVTQYLVREARRITDAAVAELQSKQSWEPAREARRLTFYGRVPEAYRFAQGIYTLHGKADSLSLTMSIQAALNGRRDHAFASGL